MVSNSSIGSKVAVGVAWMMGTRWVIRIAGLVSTLVLARLLTPEDFGLVALAVSIIAVLDVASDFGFNYALIHFQDAGREEYDTAWTLNVCRGIVIALIMAAVSPLAAIVFGDERIVPLMIVLGISFAVGSAKNIGTVDFMKRLNFSREFYIQSMPKLLGVSVAILVAWLYRSYWALVLATMTNRTTVLVMSFYMSDYRPKWALGGWRKLFSFSGWLMATQVLQAIILRMERFILGAMMTPAVVGLYHVGYEVSSMVTSELAVPIRSALFPGLAAQSSDVAAMKQLWFRSVDVLTAVGLPIGIGLGLVASEFIPVVLGEQWFMAIPVVQVLAPVLGGLVIIGSHSTILMALGRTDMLLRITLVQFPLRAILITALIASSGLAGAVIAQALTGLVWFAQILVSTSRATGIAWLEPFRRTWRSFVSAGVMSICVAGVGHWLGAGPAMMSDGWLLTWKVACGAVTYTVTHWLLWQIAARPDGIERIAFAALSEMRGRAAG